MSIYSDCKSGVVQEGEAMFPFGAIHAERDWALILEMMDRIPKNGERLMGTDELLNLYD